MFVEKSAWSPTDKQLSNKGTLDIARSTNKELNEVTDEIIKSSKTYERNNKQYIILNNKYNLSVPEQKSLKRLGNNEDIVIKPADKGGCVVIQNKDNYVIEGNKQLGDSNYYQEINKPLQPLNKARIEKILNNMVDEKYITDKQFEYLSGPEIYRPRIFYLLPKIHKDMNSWTIPYQVPPGRPIVSDINSESYRISKYLDSFLKPLACQHISYLKNTQDFINKIRNLEINKDTILVTGDVSALYTNMQHDRIIQTMEAIFQKYPNPNRPDKHIIQLMNLILKNNDFVFNDKIYKQTCGCPMGKVFGPSLANIYLIEFDVAAMTGYHIKPTIFLRYLDDIFMLWNDSRDNLTKFETFLNTLIPKINIKLESSTESINFLDVTIFKTKTVSGYILQTKVFIKPTDAQNLLHRTSFHPKHTFNGVLKSQLIRYKEISSTWELYVGACKRLFHNLKNRGYTLSLMWKQMKNIWYNNNNKKPTEPKNEKQIFPIVLKYSNTGRVLGKKYREIMGKHEIFNKYNKIIAYSNNSNIGRSLVRSSLNRVMQTNVDNNKTRHYSLRCNEDTCGTCKIMIEDNTFSSHGTGETFYLKTSLNCTSNNIIYLVTCRQCNKQYVGNTTNTLRNIMRKQIDCIIKNKKTILGIHFNQPEHKWTDILIQPIDRTSCNNINRHKILKNLERFWSQRLKTVQPRGLNYAQTKASRTTHPVTGTMYNGTGFNRCTSIRCQMCLKFIKSNGIITSTKNNQTFLINKQFTCISRNVIYVITCTKCNIQYVGETNQTLRDRLNNHLSNIKTKKITPIANHFNTTEHKISDLVIQPVDEPPENNEETRRKLERLWMKRLETIHPHGLNFIPAFKNKHLYNK